LENLKIEGTVNSPSVDFDFQANLLKLAGMSYQEDGFSFYKLILETLDRYLNSRENTEITFSFAMSYFNSSAARNIMRLFDRLDLAAKQGNKISVIWLYQEDDETIEEQGEEFGEDLEHASFELKPVSVFKK
jgi:hypothetical protein